VSPAPPCPITGASGSRLVERVSANLLIGLWKAAFRVDTAAQLRPGSDYGLWESPCGLVFFEPRVAGDADFYRKLYPAWTRDGPWSRSAAPRADFIRAASLVRPGDRVLDVGCGAGAFAACVPAARYVGLDSNYPAAGGGPDIRNETLAVHAAACPAAYDVACAFHVLEHVADPLRFATDLVRCVRPGGLVILAVPKYPSAVNDIPDCMFNAPPHHLTWWSERALVALSVAAGLEVHFLGGLPLGAHHKLGHWMGRVAPKLTRERYFKASRAWYAALAWSAGAGFLCSVLFGAPRGAPPIELLLVGRRPGEDPAPQA
jgi:2-polyprenyl-3-methyl-5-hydroxy-6-metoxy-1,4-benzoquinol methylase